jgi:hypothetical protein
MASENFNEAVRGWVDSGRRCGAADKERQQAITEKLAATEKLARLIIPSDVKQGETIAVWVRTGYREERLLAVTWRGGATYEIEYRGLPRKEEDDESA